MQRATDKMFDRTRSFPVWKLRSATKAIAAFTRLHHDTFLKGSEDILKGQKSTGIIASDGSKLPRVFIEGVKMNSRLSVRERCVALVVSLIWKSICLHRRQSDGRHTRSIWRKRHFRGIFGKSVWLASSLDMNWIKCDVSRISYVSVSNLKDVLMTSWYNGSEVVLKNHALRLRND